MEAVEDHFTCQPGYLSYKKGDIIKLKPDRFSVGATSLPPPQPGNSCYVKTSHFTSNTMLSGEQYYDTTYLRQ